MNNYLFRFFFRGGKNFGNKDFFLSDKEIDSVNAMMRQFLIFFYKNNIPPKEVLINFSLDDKETITSIIAKDRGYKVNIRKPKEERSFYC